MQCKLLLLVFVVAVGFFSTSFSNYSIAGEKAIVHYQYQQDPGIDLSKMSRGPIFVGSLNVQESATKLLPANSVANILSSALNQSLKKAKAPIAASKKDAGLIVQGNVIEFTQDDSSKKISIKAHLSLHREGRSIWENTFIGKSKNVDSLESGISEALDQLLDELYYDDYFLNEVES